MVLVGREILSVSHGIMFTDLCQTMFGQFQVRFKAFAEDADYQAGPAFKDMLVHGTKHRRIGCIAAMRITGIDIPHVRFYAIDNPFASPGKRLSDTDTGRLTPAHD